MPGTGETDADWVEKPSVRLTRLERQVAHNTRALDQGIFDQGEMRRDIGDLNSSVRRIQHTLELDQSAEIADLKRRAELPRRILLAVAIPVLIAVITALALAAVGHVHVV